MLEVALITPLLLLLLGGVGDLGRAFYYKIAVTNTAREAAHWATLGPAPTDDQILNLVSTPSQESYGICLASNGPNCSSGNGGLAPSSVVNAAPGTMTPQELANPSDDPHLSPGHSFLFIYPGFSGRTSLAPGMHWAEVASSSHIITAPAPDQGGLEDVLKAAGGSLYPVTADAASSSCYTWTGVTLSQTSFTTQNTPTYQVGPLIATLTGISGSNGAKNKANFTVNQDVSVPSFQQTWTSSANATGSIDPSSTPPISDTVTMSDKKAATPGSYTYQVQVTSTGGGCTQQAVTANFTVTIPPAPSPSPSPSPSPTATPTATPSTSPAPTPSGGSGPAPLGRQITCTVIYYFTPVTPLGLVTGPNVYIVGTATLQVTY
jgi:hypothetical protein